MALIRMSSPVIYVLIVAKILTITCQLTTAYTDEENFAFIDKILESLNNNKECHLPTYDEIDEVQNCFNSLEANYGESFNSKLNEDQRLLKNTVLYQWESFQKRMTSAVVIRSAKFRSYLCKIEEYQQAKFGSSICTQIKVTSGPIVDRVFEKNPIVRYIKHLETKDVPDPDTAPAILHTPIEPEVVEPEPPVTETPPAEVPEADKPDEKESAEAIDALIEEEKKDEKYDPLADIPVPAAEDPVDSSGGDDVNHEKESIVPQPEIVIEDTPEESKIEDSKPANNDEIEVKKKREPPQQQYVEEEDSYDDLNRLDRLDRDDWDYDPRYGYFIWPDEEPAKGNDKGKNSSNKPSWIQFLLEPLVCDNQELDPAAAEPEVKPSLRRRKKEFMNGLAAEYHYQQSQKTFGWNNCKRDLDENDRWIKILDTNFCHLSVNRDYVKTRLLGVKSVFGLKNDSSSNSKCLRG